MEKKIWIVWITSGIILCLVVIVAVSYLLDLQNDNKGLNGQEQKAMINIALGDDVFKWYLNDLKYNVTKIDLDNDYVLFDLGNGSSYWESVIVGVDRAGNKTTYVYLMGVQKKNPDIVAKMAKTALQNDTVKSYLNVQRYDINDVNTTRQQVVFDVGNMTDTWGHLLVGVDLVSNKTTYVTYLPQTPFAFPSGNMSVYRDNNTSYK